MSENEGPTAETSVNASGEQPERLPHEEVEEYGAGHIKARHGRVDAWLLVVYGVLLIWALYYGYRFWGGLGPGLDY